MEKIPDRCDWQCSLSSNPDYLDAYSGLFGKSLEEVIKIFENNPVLAHDWLVYVPIIPFEYYVQAFERILRSADSSLENWELPNIATSYLGLFLYKLQTENDSIIPIVERHLPLLKRILDNPESFGIRVEKGDTISTTFQKFKRLLHHKGIVLEWSAGDEFVP